MNFKTFVFFAGASGLLIAGLVLVKDNNFVLVESKRLAKPVVKNLSKKDVAPPLIEFHGPRFNAQNVPKEYGFWSFAIVESGKLSRSGQPNRNDFVYLKEAGYKTVVSLRTPGEYDEETSDEVISGMSSGELGFVQLPIPDGGVPTTKQAEQFLSIVKNSTGPVHVHCRGGIGRAGVMTALYRFEVDKWPMEKAIEESRLFEGGVDSQQRDWLLDWATSRYNRS